MDPSSSHSLVPTMTSSALDDDTTQTFLPVVPPHMIPQEPVQSNHPTPVIMPVNFGPSHEKGNSGEAFSSVSRMKQRRVSTSALPTLSNPEMEFTGQLSHWTFRDEMGIPPRMSVAPPIQTPRATSERRELPGGIKKSKPRKSLSNDGDASQASASSFAAPNPPKRAKRNMWSEKETHHLVEGCNIVCFWFALIGSQA